MNKKDDDSFESDESYEILSSMSPRLNKFKKHPATKKGYGKLALRRQIRRSSIYDKLQPTIKLRDVVAVTDSSNESASTHSFRSAIDGTVFEDEPPIANEHLTTSKYIRIKNWINSGVPPDSVIDDKNDDDMDEKFNNMTLEDEVDDTQKESSFEITSNGNIEDCHKKECIPKDSSDYENILDQIYGNDWRDKQDKILPASEVKSKTKKVPVGTYPKTEIKSGRNCKNLTHKGIKVRTDLFKTKKTKTWEIKAKLSIDSGSDEDGDSNKSNNNLDLKPEDQKVISNSVISISSSNSSLSDKQIDRSNGNSLTKNTYFNSDIVPKPQFTEFQTPKSKPNNLNCYMNILDQIYGDQWRKNQNDVAPTSEIKKKTKKVDVATHPKSEIKKDRVREGLTNGSRTTLFGTRKAKQLEFSWVNRLKSLCDEDSDVDKDNSKNCSFEEQVSERRSNSVGGRKSLSSSQSSGRYSDDEQGGRKGRPGKQVENGDSNNLSSVSFSDLSDIGPSLEERLNAKDVLGRKTKKPVGKRKAATRKFIVPSDQSSSSESDVEDERCSDKSKDVDIPKKTSKPARFKDPQQQRPPPNNRNEKTQLTRNTEKGDVQYSFLASLSQSVPLSMCDFQAAIYRKCFKERKHELLQKLFKLYNEKIFDNAIPADTPLEWSTRMRSTGGTCSCRKITRSTGEVERKVRIVLSTKVIDSPDRLRDTLVHEMCHAATWVVNKVSDGHGPMWKAWTVKAMKIFPELPQIKTCHNYAINCKYTYKCKGCGYSFGRHSKSINLERKCCGYCRGTFEVLINKVTKTGEKVAVATPKKPPTGFALFVKENYANYKTDSRSHADVMKTLGQAFQQLKVDNKV